ncbi:bifunctional diaminohydroxyphosphoribosylaminopyrimidine deaminase/5-amino-6-(5-phosphoribosylamino)uracil reductase RibD [Kineosporia sp. R_H_3]|uniref:bifunctional diaminohydroxyphosphoribosylaminopyrimidine deaminase/5-amino-6-(5-phosphoribosylamino)uracil reductase RibD n=1 Tax=Kineosporia sp. R_H_3 TaxID=1961848 RepID=UPI000B4BDC84|nr:bifunctional diaminohydroxyphosphoribosylaminopyrimidine deaminase/5-amino-6-(5-phosphoribosylamino)uracil reductase RibD [Kineosporia sp. R_H_3]
MASPTEVAAMRRALAFAARGPAGGANPQVGCVILDRTGGVAGEGWHRGAGTPHAEVDALARAGGAARGGTAVVTLEPCTHTGRTGPCSQALIDAGIARVVVGASDPNPDAAGGASVLRAAGLDVEEHVLAADAEALNRRWLHAVRTGRPFVTWKFAGTLDGRSAAADGSSRWITNPASRADVHARRAETGAVVVGTGTVLADDPHLTVRDADGRPVGRQPLRVVVGHTDVPPGARVLDDAAPTLHLRTRDPHEVLAALAAREVRHVWLEGGPTLAAAFLAAGAVDEVLAYVAPALLGSGASAVGDLGIRSIADVVRLDVTDVAVLDGDVRITAVPVVVGPRTAAPESTTTDAAAGTAATPSTPPQVPAEVSA